MQKHPKLLILLLLGVLMVLHFSLPVVFESTFNKAFHNTTLTNLQSTHESSPIHQHDKDEIDLSNLDFQIDESVHVEVLFKVYGYKAFIINYKATYQLDGNYSGDYHRYRATINKNAHVKLKSPLSLSELKKDHLEALQEKALLEVEKDLVKKIKL